MKPSVIQLLKCPLCSSDLNVNDTERSVLCVGSRPHCFDFSKSGYLNLAPRGGEGDGKDAVRARRRFLGAGYYQPLSDAVNALLLQIGAKTVLDAGCGEGYYTNRFPNHTDVIGIDLSRDGIDAAAKTAKTLQNGTGFAVSSIFSIPIRDHVMDAVVNIFAPCAEEEFSRVLKPGGYVILVGAGTDHLYGLKQAIYKDVHLNEGRADLPKVMTLVEKKKLQYTIYLEGGEAIADLFSMTPYYWRTTLDDKAKLEQLQSLTTQLDFDIFLFRKDLG